MEILFDKIKFTIILVDIFFCVSDFKKGRPVIVGQIIRF